jgi:hypothetical protein
VVFTPHVAFNSVEAVQGINEVTAASIRAFLAGRPINVVEPLQNSRKPADASSGVWGALTDLRRTKLQSGTRRQIRKPRLTRADQMRFLCFSPPLQRSRMSSTGMSV